MTQVEHADATIGAYGREHVTATARSTKRYVVHFFVVSYELGFDVAAYLSAAKNLTGF